MSFLEKAAESLGELLGIGKSDSGGSSIIQGGIGENGDILGNVGKLLDPDSIERIVNSVITLVVIGALSFGAVKVVQVVDDLVK